MQKAVEQGLRDSSATRQREVAQSVCEPRGQLRGLGLVLVPALHWTCQKGSPPRFPISCPHPRPAVLQCPGHPKPKGGLFAKVPPVSGSVSYAFPLGAQDPGAGLPGFSCGVSRPGLGSGVQGLWSGPMWGWLAQPSWDYWTEQ